MKHRLVIALSLSVAACGGEERNEPTEREQEQEAPPPERPLRELVGTTFEALPVPTDLNRDKVLLGRRLYHDSGLSGDGTVSCASCHMLTHGGAEPRRTSTGIRGQTGPINSPTVLNAVYNFRQFWDGRAADLREQAAGPIGNPIEMGAEWPRILEYVGADADYAAAFTSVYGANGVTQENILDAIVEYERQLVTPSRFDRWLGGEDAALTEEEQRGLRVFVDTGCTTCHRGRNVGGDSYQRLGMVHNYFERRGGALSDADHGRFNVTHAEEDRHRFKVPTLRNVALTPPYFHDGSEPELAGAVRTMAYVQLGRELEDADVNAVVAFLGSLTGDLPADALMPTSGTEQAPAEQAPAEQAPAEQAPAP
jgi:cytochrome c peroxidase